MVVRDVVVRLSAEASSCPRADRQTGTGALTITCSLFPGLERQGLEADHSHSNAETWNEWRCTSTTPYGFMLCAGTTYRGADKSLARPGRKQAQKHVRDARFQQHRDASCHQVPPLQGKAPKEIHTILTETLACFLPGRTKDLSAPM